MTDMLEIHKQLLLDAAEVCHSLPAEIETFAFIVSSLPQELVKLRLTLIQSMIILGERYLRLRHGGKGFIFVQVGHGMLRIRWAELDLLEGQKVSTGSSGGVFVVSEVVMDKVKELLSRVDRGELVAAVDWLSHYGEINIDGLNLLDWTGSLEKKDAAKLNVTTERKKEIGNLPVRGESSVYVVSLTGRKPESVGNVQPHAEMFRRFRFLLFTRGNFCRMLKTQLFRIKSLFSHISNLMR